MVSTHLVISAESRCSQHKWHEQALRCVVQVSAAKLSSSQLDNIANSHIPVAVAPWMHREISFLEHMCARQGSPAKITR